jgi:hypothetical protein
VVSNTSSLSSESSSSEFVSASPLPILELVISPELPDIPEMPEVEAAQQMMELAVTGPRLGTSADILLYILWCCVADSADCDIFGAGVGDGNVADVVLRQMV